MEPARDPCRRVKSRVVGAEKSSPAGWCAGPRNRPVATSPSPEDLWAVILENLQLDQVNLVSSSTGIYHCEENDCSAGWRGCFVQRYVNLPFAADYGFPLPLSMARRVGAERRDTIKVADQVYVGARPLAFFNQLPKVAVATGILQAR